MRQVVTFRDSFTSLGSEPVTAELEGEARLVDGTLYALAAYSQPYPDGSQAVPDGWVVVDDASLLDLYPGSGALIPAEALAAPPSVLPGRCVLVRRNALGIRPHDPITWPRPVNQAPEWARRSRSPWARQPPGNWACSFRRAIGQARQSMNPSRPIR